MTEAQRQRAFEALYADTADAVFRYALRRTGREADADDVVAETFAIAWRRLADLPARRELPWLYGVARRVLANQRRTAGRQNRLRDRLRSEPLVADVPTADEGLVLAVLGQLPANDQEVLRLALWEQLSTEDIAVALGASHNAVYIRLHRARQRFATLFEQAQAREQEGER